MKQIVLILLACIGLASCNNSQKSGDYVYVDGRKQLHSNKKCNLVYEHSPLEEYTLDAFCSIAYHEDYSWYPCTKCMSGKTYEELTRRITIIREIKENELKLFREEYDALCELGECQFDSFEEYYNYAIIDDNRNFLDNKLQKNGYCLNDLRWNYSKSYGEDDINTKPNKQYLLWLYLHLRAAGVVNSSFDDFKHRLGGKNDFVMFYEKSCELGLVDCWGDFIALLFESDCDYCKEEHWEEWEEEMKGQWEEEYRDEYLYDQDLDDYEYDRHL